MRAFYLFIFLLICLFSSCMKNIDGPLNIPKPIHNEMEIPLLEDYSQRVYYSLEKNEIVKIDNAKNWDIAFRTTFQKKNNIILNSSIGTNVSMVNTFFSNINALIEPSFFTNNINRKKYCNYIENIINGLDEIIFLDNETIKIKSDVALLNLSDNNVRMYKFQILEYTKEKVIFKYANLSESVINIDTVLLDQNQNFAYYSFSNKSQIDVEPKDKTSWDIEFCKYAQFVTQFDTTKYYSITGAISNPNFSIGSYYIENKKIDELDINIVDYLKFNFSLTSIGFSWKSFTSPSFDGNYKIEPRTYIINKYSNYYAIEFIDFYKNINNELVKGYPKFLQKKL